MHTVQYFIIFISNTTDKTQQRQIALKQMKYTKITVSNLNKVSTSTFESQCDISKINLIIQFVRDFYAILDRYEIHQFCSERKWIVNSCGILHHKACVRDIVPRKR